jgi:hypothetical protein
MSSCVAICGITTLRPRAGAISATPACSRPADIHCEPSELMAARWNSGCPFQAQVHWAPVDPPASADGKSAGSAAYDNSCARILLLWKPKTHTVTLITRTSGECRVSKRLAQLQVGESTPPARHPGTASRGQVRPAYYSQRGSEHETSLDRRGGGCRACVLRAQLGATRQSVGRKRDGYARSQPRRAGTDAVQLGSATPGGYSADGAAPVGCGTGAFNVGFHFGDAADSPPCAQRFARQDGGASSQSLSEPAGEYCCQ